MTQRRVIWDPLVRIFHWSVASLFLLNYWLWEGGEKLHRWAGYAIVGLLAIRIVWAFIGPYNARFVSFWPTTARLRHHWQQLKQRRIDDGGGHNPIGAIMILFLMALLATTAITGWMQGLDSFWGEDWVEEIHECVATTLMVAVCVHVVAVLIMSRLMGLSLILPMITGWRRITASADDEPPNSH